VPDSIDIALIHGWHVTIFRPALWLLGLIAAGLIVIAVKVWQTRMHQL
jgi:hypothetical protein